MLYTKRFFSPESDSYTSYSITFRILRNRIFQNFFLCERNFCHQVQIYHLVRDLLGDMAEKTSKPRKKALSLKERMDILTAIDKSSGKHGSKTEIAKQFGIVSSTLSTILKDRKRIESAFQQSQFQPQRKRIRAAKYEDIESGLLLWFKGVREKNVPVTGPVLQSKAEEIAKELGFENFSCSSGWVHRFKERHAIVHKRMAGEAASVSEETVESWTTITLPTLLEGFAPKDVFNADETGLFFKLLPDKTLSFKGEACHGGKLSKDRITVLVGGNADGSEKLPLLVIGKSKNPRCFKSVRSLPVEYTSSKKAWMNSDLFSNWLSKLNRHFARQDRKILLVIDNCPAHPVIDNLSHIKVVFLPPNATSRLQPMDQGVIRSMKAFYRKKLLFKMITAIDEGKEFSVSLLDALHFVNSAWNAVTSETVKNCFQKCGFFCPPSDDGENVSPDNAALDDEIGGHLQYLQQQGVQGLDSITPEIYITSDDALETAEELTTQSIVAHVQSEREEQTEEDEDDDNIEELTPVSLAEAERCMDKLRRFFETREATHDFYSMLDQMESFTSKLRVSSRQTTISDYFRKI